jgi:hypothetical protein
MTVPAEQATRFKFACRESRLAGTTGGSYFVLKNGY